MSDNVRLKTAPTIRNTGKKFCMPSPLTTPAADGYRMPAEWEEHTRTWMLWPYRPDVWRENARPAQAAFAQVAAAITRFEPVTVIALPAMADEARR